MPVTVKHGSQKSIPMMKALWREVFHDTDEFIDMFFEKLYSPSRTLLAFENGELVSMLYRMEVKLKYFKKNLKCAYLYGVATKPSEQRRGHFTRLHNQMLEELKKKNYDAVLVIPASEALFGFYKELGYTASLKKYEYRLLTQDITEVTEAEDIWQAKRAIHRRSEFGISVLETLEQFKESRKGHKFFSYSTAFLAFAPEKNGYRLYEVISPKGEYVPVEQVHYEKSALLMDLNEAFDKELIEKQKPMLNFLLN